MCCTSALAICRQSKHSVAAEKIATLTVRPLHLCLVTYPDAPHSFFDRKAADFAAESAAAWDEVTAFIAAHGG